MSRPVTVRGLRVEAESSRAAVIDEIDLDVPAGEILALVGESGSGKTTLGLALLRYAARGLRIDRGRVTIGEHELLGLDARAIRMLRGRTVAYVPQSPESALNPALRIGTQLRECLAGRGQPVLDRVREVLAEVVLPTDDEFLRRYPHQLSGGQQQRVAIAMAFIARPDLIVLDEPTTGLDVVTQARVLRTLRLMCARYGAAAVYISHDMAVVANLAHRIAIMYAGRIVESGPARQVLADPRHPYTRRLLLAVPDPTGRRPMVGIGGHPPAPSVRPEGCSFAARCPLADDECRWTAPSATPVAAGQLVRCFHPGHEQPLPAPVVVTLPSAPAGAPPIIQIRSMRARYGDRQVLHGIELEIPRGHCVALLGASGSGKTTLARCVIGLHRQFTGDLVFGGTPLPHLSHQRTVEQRRRLQYIFQDPYRSLNPRRTVGQTILRPLTVLHRKTSDRGRILADVMDRVALRQDLADRYPEQLSGGECQRVAIARALVAEPEVLICDEITSALDVSAQASIVELLKGLQSTLGLSLLFVTHNLALTRNIAQTVAVLEKGQIVEHRPVADVFGTPRHPYTESLLAGLSNLDASS